MAETMIERVRAIVSEALAEERREGMFSKWDPDTTTRAILTAMREPTEAMVNNTTLQEHIDQDWCSNSAYDELPRDIWPRMIDAALAE